MKAFVYATTWLLCLLAWPLPQLQAANLHAIIVADYFSPDISQASNIDLQRVKQEIKRIATDGGYRLKCSQFAGHKAMGKMLLSSIKHLKASHDDLIFFYFSGHGYRTTHDRKS